MRHRWLYILLVVSLTGCSTTAGSRLPWRRAAAEAEAAAAQQSPAERFQEAQKLFDDGEFAQAIIAYQDVVDRDADGNFSDIAQLSIARAHVELGEYEEAGEAYQLTLDEYPLTGLLTEVADGQLKLGDLYYAQAVETAKRPQRFAGLRQFFRPTNDFDRAVEQYENAVGNLPFSGTAAAAQYRIGRAWQQVAEYEDAIDAYEQVLDAYPSSSWAREAAFGIAESQFLSAKPWAYDQTSAQRATEGLLYYRRAYGPDDRDPEIDRMLVALEDSVAAHNFEIGAWYHRLYQFDAARIYYRQVVIEYPDTEWARRAREQLALLP